MFYFFDSGFCEIFNLCDFPHVITTVGNLIEIDSAVVLYSPNNNFKQGTNSSHVTGDVSPRGKMHHQHYNYPCCFPPPPPPPTPPTPPIFLFKPSPHPPNPLPPPSLPSLPSLPPPSVLRQADRMGVIYNVLSLSIAVKWYEVNHSGKSNERQEKSFPRARFKWSIRYGDGGGGGVWRKKGVPRMSGCGVGR